MEITNIRAQIKKNKMNDFISSWNIFPFYNWHWKWIWCVCMIRELQVRIFCFIDDRCLVLSLARIRWCYFDHFVFHVLSYQDPGIKIYPRVSHGRNSWTTNKQHSDDMCIVTLYVTCCSFIIQLLFLPCKTWVGPDQGVLMRPCRLGQTVITMV